MTTQIVEITNYHPDFYPWLGPFLGSREVHKELGGPVYDDAGKRWWVARVGSITAGFCALTVEARTVHLQSAYVLPAMREDGIYAALFEARLAAARALELPIRAVVRPDAKKLFVRHRFTVVRELTNYTVFELAPKGATSPKRRAK